MFAPWYDRQGRPISALRWAELHSDLSYRVVAQHWLKGWKVSTVWLGIDHSFGDGPPVIFETMIFAPSDEQKDVGLDGYQWRYRTEEAALAGHDQVLALICEKLGESADSAVTAAQFQDFDSFVAELATIDELEAMIRREQGWELCTRSGPFI